MLARQNNQRLHANLSPKEALRAHVEQLSPTQQREFIATALGLITTRTLIAQTEATLHHTQPRCMAKQSVTH